MVRALLIKLQRTLAYVLERVTPGGTSSTEPESRIGADIILFLCLIINLYGLFIFLFPLLAYDPLRSFYAAGIVAAPAMTSFVVGGAFGFLFGIPKTEYSKEEESFRYQGISHKVNSNLEQISDWLTKIIIGLGLVEYEQIYELVVNIGANISKSTDYMLSATFTTSSIILTFVLGFITGLLWTRLIISKAIKLADENLSRQIIIARFTQQTIQEKDIKKSNIEAEAKKDPATTTTQVQVNFQNSLRAVRQELVEADTAPLILRFQDLLRSTKEQLREFAQDISNYTPPTR